VSRKSGCLECSTIPDSKIQTLRLLLFSEDLREDLTVHVSARQNYSHISRVLRQLLKNTAAAAAAPEGSTSNFIRKSKKRIVSRISSSETVSTSSAFC